MVAPCWGFCLPEPIGPGPPEPPLFFLPYQEPSTTVGTASDTLTQVSQSVSLRTEEYKLDGVDDLPGLGQDRIHRLEIGCRDPYLSVDLEPSRVFVYASDDRPEVRGVFHQLLDFLRTRSAPLPTLRRNTVLPSILLVSSLWFLVPSPAGEARTDVLSISIALLLLVGSIIWIRLCFTNQFKKYSTIVLSSRVEAQSFWVRRRDDILLALISAVIASLLTLVVTLLI